jgi:hypothetical protein
MIELTDATRDWADHQQTGEPVLDGLEGPIPYMTKVW